MWYGMTVPMREGRAHRGRALSLNAWRPLGTRFSGEQHVRERRHRASALAQRMAAARASREQHVHSPCPCAHELLNCTLQGLIHRHTRQPAATVLIARLAKAHTRAHVSINKTCSDTWLAGVAQIRMEFSESNEKLRTTSRALGRWRSLPHTPQAGATHLQNQGAQHSCSAVASFFARSSTGTGAYLVAVPVATAGCVPRDARK